MYDIGDDVALVDFHSPKQAIGGDLMQMLHFAMQKVRSDFRGLVVSSHVQPNFSVGANLALILMAAQEGEWEEVDLAVRQFQGVNQALKYFERPVVVAPYGMTLGGGAELSFAGDRVVAAFETYIGLVEVGAGLIPGGGGCKEMLIRTMEGTPGLLDGAAGGAMHTRVDPQPLVNKAFEIIGTAKVATSAPEAVAAATTCARRTRSWPTSTILWHEAKQAVLELDAAGYRPPPRPIFRCWAPTDGRCWSWARSSCTGRATPPSTISHRPQAGLRLDGRRRARGHAGHRTVFARPGAAGISAACAAIPRRWPACSTFSRRANRCEIKERDGDARRGDRGRCENTHRTKPTEAH